MISIIIPAHNEENTIGRCLQALLSDAGDGQCEIIAVCNGCKDNTMKIVRSFGKAVQGIETEIASKAYALNLGDEAAVGFPRFYLDADVVLSFETIRKVAAVLDSGHYLAAAPTMKTDCSHSTWFVRSYYTIWQNLPYVREGMIGAGVYALSREGRSRFEKFPDIIGDDRFIRALFKTHERVAVKGCNSNVVAPRNLKGLIKIE